MNRSDLQSLLALGDDERPLHFMGIGGAGMSALAELLVNRGVRLEGCDSNPGAAPELTRLGVTVAAQHDPAHAELARAIVVTAAVTRDHPELERARSLGIPVIRRADALGAAVSEARTVVAVAGTHGKTTTTALTTDALAAAGLDPTGLAGGRVPAWGGHLWRGGENVIVVEADEYDRSFLSITPGVAVITNIEADHLDIYSDLADIRAAFEQFARPARIIVCCADDEVARTLSTSSTAEVVRYGIESPDARLRAVRVQPSGAGYWFAVEYDGEELGEIRLPVAGRHNVRNSLAAIGTGLALGMSLSQMRPGLESFAGVDRRFQRIGKFRGVTIVDDYAHHPTEIAATLDAARAAAPGARVVAAFQPHLYSRTRDFSGEFAQALLAADAVFLTDIYGARERAIPGVTSDVIAKPMAASGRPPAWCGSRQELAGQLAGFVREGDIVLTLGAGDITRTAYELRDLLGVETAG
jgi:UDP-N-acetylmuramate--alanine ligase